MAVLALLISVVSILLAGASLWWQVKSWHDSGPKIHVCFMMAVRDGNPFAFRGVQVTNSGRAATVVQGVGAQLPNKMYIPLVADSFGQIDFPAKLEPGQSFSAFWPPDYVEETLGKTGSMTVRVKALARTGHGTFTGKAQEIDPADRQ